MSSSHRLRRLTALAVACGLVVPILSAPTSASARDPGLTGRSIQGRAVAQPVAAPLGPGADASVPTTAKPAAGPVAKPARPAAPTAARQGSVAVVTWKAPADKGSAITGYVVTPYRDGTARTAVSYDASATSRKLTGLTGSGDWTFTVAARNKVGLGKASPRSKPAKLLALPGAPTIIATTAFVNSVLLSWLPGSDGGSPITGYQVTPYIGTLIQPAQVFGPSTTNTVTGLTPSVTYRFTVAARTAAGVGPASPLSIPVTPNVSPGLIFPTPAQASINAAYFNPLTATNGRPPLTWSVASGSLPPGVSIDPVSGTLTGVPEVVGSQRVVVAATDAVGRTGTKLTTVVVNRAPVITPSDLPLGEIGAVYTAQLSSVGGTGPFTWSLSSGALPAGLSIDPDDGVIIGRPTVVGTFGAVLEITDANGLTDTQPIQVVVQERSTVVLSSSTPTANFALAVNLTVNIGPGRVGGNVTVIDQLPNGLDSVLGSFPVTLNRTVIPIQLPAFGANTLRVQYDATITNAVATSNAVAVQVVGQRGQLLIDQLRQAGAGGVTDQYVQLYNNTNQRMILADVRIEAPGGIVITLPDTALPVPARGSYLVATAGYQLPGVAPDFVVPSLGQGGVRVVATDIANTLLDAVGTAPGFSSGTPLPAFTSTPNVPNAWTRRTVNGGPQTTHNNAADFTLVATVPGLVGGLPAALGAPSPTSSLGVNPRNDALQSTLLDPELAAGASPNRQLIPAGAGQPLRLVIRRIITNRTGESITQTRIRITSLSQVNGAPPPGLPMPPTHANLRLINPTTPTSTITIGDGRTFTVQNLSMTAPNTDPPGGGLESSLPIPFLLGGLAPGASVAIALTFAVDSPGSFWLSYDVDAFGLDEPSPTTETPGAAATADRQRLATSLKLARDRGTLR